jgi:hypothetical protein
LKRIINVILRHLFSPPNNTRLSHLCGPMDAHLRTIETALQVRIAHRHEQFKVEGTQDPTPSVRMEMLQALYEMAARPIEPRHGAADALGRPGDVNSAEGPALKTRRADLKPRSMNQAQLPGLHRQLRHHLWHRPGWHRQNLPGRGHGGGRPAAQHGATHCADAPGGGSR